MRGNAEDVTGVLAQIARLQPDIAVLRGIDYDHDLVAVQLMQASLAELGHEMPFRFALPPNSGVPTEFDLDRDGRTGRARDKQGYGLFRGNGGIAILSRFEIVQDRVLDMSAFLWKDLPGTTLPKTDTGYYYTPAEMEVLRLHSVAAWVVPIVLPQGVVHILTSHANTPVFDGPEDRNGLRNAAEISFWIHYLEDALPGLSGVDPDHVIYAGGLNADPNDGEGAHAMIAEILTHPLLQNSDPASKGGVAHANPEHLSNPAFDTVDWPETERYPGNLRVDYLLPGLGLQIIASGVDWPVVPPDAGFGSAHRPVWLEFELLSSD